MISALTRSAFASFARRLVLPSARPHSIWERYMGLVPAALASSAWVKPRYSRMTFTRFSLRSRFTRPSGNVSSSPDSMRFRIRAASRASTLSSSASRPSTSRSYSDFGRMTMSSPLGVLMTWAPISCLLSVNLASMPDADNAEDHAGVGENDPIFSHPKAQRFRSLERLNLIGERHRIDSQFRNLVLYPILDRRRKGHELAQSFVRPDDRFHDRQYILEL